MKKIKEIDHLTGKTFVLSLYPVSIYDDVWLRIEIYSIKQVIYIC